MPEKNLRPDTKVLITGNVYDDAGVEEVLALPALERVGFVVAEGEPCEQWGERWIVQTSKGTLTVSEQDLSPIPTLDRAPTHRGFPCGQFTDLYGSECSIQQSSLATEGALWFGVEDGGHFNMKTPSEKWRESVHGKQSTGGRMHLSQGQAAALLPLLQYFVEHGTLPLKDEE
jgi:hypothetical protein